MSSNLASNVYIKKFKKFKKTTEMRKEHWGWGVRLVEKYFRDCGSQRKYIPQQKRRGKETLGWGLC